MATTIKDMVTLCEDGLWKPLAYEPAVQWQRRRFNNDADAMCKLAMDWQRPVVFIVDYYDFLPLGVCLLASSDASGPRLLHPWEVEFSIVSAM